MIEGRRKHSLPFMQNQVLILHSESGDTFFAIWDTLEYHLPYSYFKHHQNALCTFEMKTILKYRTLIMIR